ncbi:MAG: glutamyl-tRNA reductase [Vulcanimicrobiaceae bacterium]
MPLVCLGLSHRTAPVEVRERHAFPPAKMGEALVALHDYETVHEAAMLQTCGRLEIYAELEDYETGVAQLNEFLQRFRHAGVEDMGSYLYTLLGVQAVDHLFRVATGLDSMLIGEAEILGQVKDAYIQAQRAQSLGKVLHALFREALSAGKVARTETPIGREYVSVATAAIDLAKQRLGTIAGASVLVIGAGKMGTTAAKRLKSEGAGELVVVNRSVARARDVVERLGVGRASELPNLTAALANADIVITSTGAPHFVLTPENVAAAMNARPDRPLFIVDIAVPRDVDPEVSALRAVTVVDIDALKGAVETNLDQRRAAIPLVDEIIVEHVERYAQWYRAQVAIPVVSSLTQKAEAIRVTEIERLFARCPELTERERMLITGASLTIISKLLHTVIVRIREKAVADRGEALTHARILEELFDLQMRTAELLIAPEPSRALSGPA